MHGVRVRVCADTCTCVRAPVTMPGRAHHSAGLSPEHRAPAQRGFLSSPPWPTGPTPGPWGQRHAGSQCPPTRQGTSWSAPWGPLPSWQFQPGGEAVFSIWLCF